MKKIKNKKNMSAKKIEVVEKYVVYELNKTLGSEKHLTLEKVEFKDWKPNSFDTENEAIHALIDDERTYFDYLILKRVFLRTA